MHFLKKILKYKINFTLSFTVLLAFLLIVNFLSYQFYKTWDLTQNKDYSISKATKKILSNLDDIVTIKVYFSKNLPSRYVNLKQEVSDVLNEYVNYSHGKIVYQFIDPKEDGSDELIKELMILGIPKLQFNVLEKDKYQVVQGYLGMGIYYKDKKEAIPVVDNTDNLEYELTSAIKKAISKKTITIGWASGNDELDIENEAHIAYKKLSELYQVRIVNLSNLEKIPEDISSLIVAGPKKKFNKKEKYLLDQFLLRGKSIFFLVDGVVVDNHLLAKKNDFDLQKLFNNYGIQFNKDLVLDSSNAMASFTQGYVTYMTNYPFWPKINQFGFDKNNPAVSKLESLILPWVSNVSILENKKINKNKYSELVKTTNRAWLMQNSFDLNPHQNFIVNSQNQYSLAVFESGHFESYFKDKNKPIKNNKVKFIKSTDNGKLVIVGDSDFIKDNFVNRFRDNLLFFQNITDYLNLDQDLINIRSRGITNRPIKELSESNKLIIRYVNIFGISILIILFGIARYVMRKRN